MTYEYEHRLRNYLIGHKNVNPKFEGFEILKSLDELKEVYRKARAWDKLKELLIKEYPEVAHLAEVSNGEGERGEMSKHGEVLEHMDKLDGTKEFSNLLSDLEDE